MNNNKLYPSCLYTCFQILLIVMLGKSVQAQEISRSSLNAAGTIITSTESNTLSWTLGQVFQLKVKGNDHSVSFGFQQAALMITSSINLFPDFEVTIYPNPTTENLVVDTDDSPNHDPIKYQIMDVRSQRIKEGILSDTNNSISVSDLYSGSYILFLFKKDQLIHSSIFIKH